ncbi:MAG: SH3 domain-containing protein [Lachnospiraceae bacterium]|nr:SH3 domain-containing protein [Lachnospiraceae bacterium]
MKKSRLAWIVLLIFLFTACGSKEANVSSDSVSGDAVVQEEELTPTATPTTEVPTPTEKVAAEPTESDPEEEEPTPSENTAEEKMAESHTLYATGQDGTNVRSGPGTQYDILGTLAKGEAVEAYGEAENGWFEVEYKGAKGYASANYLSEETEDKQAAAEPAAAEPTAAAEGDAQPPAAEPTEAPAAVPTTPPVAAVAPAGVLMIGDSRCVQMRDQSGGCGAMWICENGKGYDWFVETAIPQADPIVGRGTKVVICLGVNDTDHGYSYATMINSLAATWGARGAKLYYVSVNPVSDNPWTTMEEVLGINNYMISNLIGVRYIDTCSYLIANGYNMIDGMHFDAATNLLILNLIFGSLR